MIRFKACPKCHGDLYLAEDIHGQFLNCIQCGYLRDLSPEAADLEGGGLLVSPGVELEQQAA